MIRPEYVDLGQLSPSRLRRIADVFASEGFVAPDRSLKGLVLDDYMRGDDSARRRLIALTVGILIAIAVSLGLFGINRRLKVLVHQRTNDLRIANEQLQTELAERERAETELQEAHDMLERRVAERTAQLEAAGRAQEAFSYSVSHDLRGPLRALDGFSRILLQDHAGSLNAEARDYLTRIKDAAVRMGALVDDLLKLSRINRTELQVVNVDLSELASDIAAVLQESSPGRDVTWVIAPRISARGDAALLSTLLDNLLSNAWKYTGKKERARIEFGVTARADGPVYFVKDDGAGFDMEYSGRLFTAFERLHSETEFPGNGIGLATVQRIVDIHGGKAWAVGQVDHGATFYFTLHPPA
jgi:light-regulated signal transduction histidine kinase (bacteriophytochrome)